VGQEKLVKCPRCGYVNRAVCPSGRCERLVIVCDRCGAVFIVEMR